MIFAAGFRFDEREIHFAVDQDIRTAAEQTMERVAKARTRAIAFIVRMQNQHLRIPDFRAKILRSEHEFALLNANGMQACRLQKLARAVRKAINAAAALFLCAKFPEHSLTAIGNDECIYKIQLFYA